MLGQCHRLYPRAREFGHIPRHKRWISNAASSYMKVLPEVQEALNSGTPVVALESTIYTHGFPYPENAILARHLENVVRRHGGIPATVAVLDGMARVGLSNEELELLTQPLSSESKRKVSRRDLSYILGQKIANKTLHGGTTVSGTMLLAKLAGIDVFATGGLGGVHRGAENTMDISADLTELGKTAINVVCSGCKSFLDIPKTLEYLETQGVGVFTFANGRKGDVDFPAFWTQDSGFKSPYSIRDEDEAADIAFAQSSVSIESGLVFANPILESHSIPRARMDDIMERALHDAEMGGHHGNRNTPFVLSRIRELTGGGSVNANRTLVENNVMRGTKIAVKLSHLKRNRHQSKIVSSAAQQPSKKSEMNSKAHSGHSIDQGCTNDRHTDDFRYTVAVLGAIALDTSCDLERTDTRMDANPTPYTSNPASIRQGLGGVAHNIARALKYHGIPTKLFSLVGDDMAGRMVKSLVKASSNNCQSLISFPAPFRTAQYVAVNSLSRDLFTAMADMSLFEASTDDLHSQLEIWKQELSRMKPRWIVIDANWSPTTIKSLINLAKQFDIRIAFEPVSKIKSQRLFSEIDGPVKEMRNGNASMKLVDLMTPNALELASMHDAAQDSGIFDLPAWFEIIDKLNLQSHDSREALIRVTGRKLVDQGIPQQAIKLLPFVSIIAVTLGDQGALLARMMDIDDPQVREPNTYSYVLNASVESGEKSTKCVYLRWFPPATKLSEQEIISVNGAGDTFTGSLIAGLEELAERSMESIIQMAQAASVESLKSIEAVNPSITELSLRND